MRKAPTPEQTARGSSTSSASGSEATYSLADQRQRAQASQPDIVDIAHVGAIWRSPRDRTRCVQADIKSFNGSAPYLDLRLFETDAAGRMRATPKGITCSAQKLPALAKLVGDAARKAHQLGLVSS